MKMKQSPKEKKGRAKDLDGSTRPAKTTVPFAGAYPRPQLRREAWTNLNGRWDVAIDERGDWLDPTEPKWAGDILVPFAPETPLSGVGNTGFFQSVWYRRTFDAPRFARHERVILHFGAVDYEATVWLNGQRVATHEGGYTPFAADVTSALAGKGEQTLIVCAKDDALDLAKPRGKQDWLRDPHSIWYPRTSGIWQTVWMEVVPESHVSALKWTPIVEEWSIQFDLRIAGPKRDDLKVEIELTGRGGKRLCQDVYRLSRDELSRTIRLADPGIDDARNEFLWYPWAPHLVEAVVRLTDDAGTLIDEVRSYTALRQATVLGDRFVFNGKPLQLQLLLDQGYWEEGGLTAPSDDAFKRDVELVKQMGFNGVRKHQKIENPRFLYWADVLGLLVWEEMPSPYRFGAETARRMTAQWAAAIERDVSHPCVVAWVPVNESWGVPDLPLVPAQRHLVQALYHLTKTLDPTRACIGNDGWEATATDIVAIHDYEANPEKIAQRYGDTADDIAHMLTKTRPGNKILLLDGFDYHGQPIMLTEFGGIAYARDVSATWGYSRARTPDDFAARYAALMATIRSLPLLAGFCYTQFTDTYQEANGLLFMDRTPKFPIEEIAVATRGPGNDQEREIDERFKQRMLNLQR